jgi:hypothetical protein
MAGLKNCTYDIIKITHELCALNWFLEKHALQDCKDSDKKTLAALIALQKDLEKHSAQFNALLHE